MRSLDKNMKSESISDMFHQPKTSTLRARESIVSGKAKRFYNIKTDVIHATYINIDRFDKIMIFCSRLLLLHNLQSLNALFPLGMNYYRHGSGSKNIY